MKNMPEIEKVRFSLTPKNANTSVKPKDVVDLMLSITLNGGQGGRPGMKFYLETDPSLLYKKASIKFVAPIEDKDQKFLGEIHDAGFSNDTSGAFSPSWEADKKRLLITIPDMSVVSDDDGQNQITLNFSLALEVGTKIGSSSKHNIKAWLVTADDDFEEKTLNFFIAPVVPDVTSLSLSGENNVHFRAEDGVFFVRDFAGARLLGALGKTAVDPINSKIYIYFKKLETNISLGRIEAVVNYTTKEFEVKDGLGALAGLITDTVPSTIEAKISYISDFSGLSDDEQRASSKIILIKIFRNSVPIVSVSNDSAVVDSKTIKLSVPKNKITSGVGISKVEYSLKPNGGLWIQMKLSPQSDIFSVILTSGMKAPLDISKGFYIRATDLCGSESAVGQVRVPVDAYAIEWAGLNEIGLDRDVELHAIIYPIGYPDEAAKGLIKSIHSANLISDDKILDLIKESDKKYFATSYLLPEIAISSVTTGNEVGISKIEVAKLKLSDSLEHPFFWVLKCHATLIDADKIDKPVSPINAVISGDFLQKNPAPLSTNISGVNYLYPVAKFHLNPGGRMTSVFHSGDKLFLQGDFDAHAPIDSGKLHAFFSVDAGKNFSAISRALFIPEKNSTRFSVDIGRFFSATTKEINNGALKILYSEDESSAYIVPDINARIQNELPIFFGSPTLTLTNSVLKGEVKFSPPKGESGTEIRAGVRWEEGGEILWTDTVPKRMGDPDVWDVELRSVDPSSIRKTISPELHLGTSDKKSLNHRHFVFSNAHDLLDVKIFAESQALTQSSKPLVMTSPGDHHVNRIKFLVPKSGDVYVKLSFKPIVGIKSMNVFVEFEESSAFKLIDNSIRITPASISGDKKVNLATDNLKKEWKNKIQLLSLRDFLSSNSECSVEFAFKVSLSGRRIVRFIFEDPEEIGVNAKTTFNLPTDYILSIENLT